MNAAELSFCKGASRDRVGGLSMQMWLLKFISCGESSTGMGKMIFRDTAGSFGSRFQRSILMCDKRSSERHLRFILDFGNIVSWSCQVLITRRKTKRLSAGLCQTMIKDFVMSKRCDLEKMLLWGDSCLHFALYYMLVHYAVGTIYESKDREIAVGKLEKWCWKLKWAGMSNRRHWDKLYVWFDALARNCIKILTSTIKKCVVALTTVI